MEWTIPPAPRAMWPLISKDFGGNLWSADPYSTEGQAYNPLRHGGQPIPRYQRAPLPWQPWPDIPWKRPNRRQRRSGIMWTAPAYASNGGTGTITASTTGTGAFSSNVTSGNTLVCYVTTLQGVATSGITDTLGNLWTVVTNGNNLSGGRITALYCNNSVGGANTLTVTIGSSGTASFAFAEYSGVGSVASNRSVVDASAGGTGNNAAPTVNATPQQSGSLVVSGVGDVTGSLTYTTTTAGLTKRQSVVGTYDVALAEQIGSTTSIAAITSAWSVTSVQWSTVAVILRPAETQAVTRLANQTSGASTVASINSTSTPKLGALLLLESMASTTGAQTSAVTDTAGNTWNLVTRSNNTSGGELSVWWAIAISGASTTFTTAYIPNSTGAFQIYEVSGVVPSASPIDQFLAAIGNGTAVSVGPTSATTLANEVAFLCVGTPGNMTSFTPGGGASCGALVNNGAQGGASLEHLPLSSTGTQTMTATLGSTQQWSAILLTIKTGGVSLVQEFNGAAGIAGQAFAFNTAPGNSLFLLTTNSQSGSITAVSDGPTNTWEQPNGSKVSIPGAGSIDFWRVRNNKGGKVLVTLTTSGSVTLKGFLVEYSGLDTSVATDVLATNTGTSTTPTVAGTVPNYLFELALAWGGNAGASVAINAGASPPYALDGYTGGSSGRLQHGTTFSPGAVPSAGSAAWTQTSTGWAALFATVKVAGSPAYYAATLTETAGTVDTLSRAQTLTRTLTEAPSATDSLTRQFTGTRTLAETSQAADTLSRQGIFGRILSEVAGIVDTLTGMIAHKPARIVTTLDYEWQITTTLDLEP